MLNPPMQNKLLSIDADLEKDIEMGEPNDTGKST